jgi:hypothetical protein
MPTDHSVHGDEHSEVRWYCHNHFAYHKRKDGSCDFSEDEEPVKNDQDDVNMITTHGGGSVGDVDIHIECNCRACISDLSDADYGTYVWYRNHCVDLGLAEWQAHDDKRIDYCGDYNNIFWMIEDTINETGLTFEQVITAWSARHWRGLIRAMRQEDKAQASKRALDLMGWLFLLLARYKGSNSQ